MTMGHAVSVSGRRPRQEGAFPPRAYGALLLLLAGVLLLNSIIGPLVLGVVSYPVTRTVENQLIGLELVTAILVAPWAAVAGMCALRGLPEAPLLGFAPAAYAAYMFAQYVLGPEYANYSITSLAQLGIFILAGGLVLWSWSLSAEVPLRRLQARQAHRRGLLLLAMALFVLFRYAGAVAGAFTGAPIEEEFELERTFFWSILLLDLGIVVPCTLAAGVAVLRASAVGPRALYAAVGWFALVPPSVTAMAVVMWANDDPSASIRAVVLLCVASVAFGALAWHVFRELLSRPKPADQLSEHGP